MSLVYVDPRVPERWGGYEVKHVRLEVAWVNTLIVGISYTGGAHDQRVDVVRNFISAQGWKATVSWRYPARLGANGLLEYCGAGLVIIWEWDQVLTWLKEGWPTKRVSPGASSPVGTLCYADGVDPMADHIDRSPTCGWAFAMKQMRTIGIPLEVRKLERRLTETEQIDALCGALKRHRVKLNHLIR